MHNIKTIKLLIHKIVLLITPYLMLATNAQMDIYLRD